MILDVLIVGASLYFVLLFGTVCVGKGRNGPFYRMRSILLMRFSSCFTPL